MGGMKKNRLNNKNKKKWKEKRKSEKAQHGTLPRNNIKSKSTRI